MPLSYEDVCQLVTAFEGSDWDEMSIVHDGTTLVLSRNGAATGAVAAGAVAAGAATASTAALSAPATAAPATAAPATAAPATAAPAPAAATPAPAPADSAATPTSGTSVPPAGEPIPAPSVGLFWRSPQPGAPPFVDVGQRIGPDDTVCIIEVMKLMNHVKAGVSGTVVAVLPDNGHMVETGQTLFLVDQA